MTDFNPLIPSAASTYARQAVNGNGNGRAAPTAPTPTRPPAADEAKISDRARLLSQLAAGSDVRHALVDRVRDAIQRGDYETPERLDGAVQALAEEIRWTT